MVETFSSLEEASANQRFLSPAGSCNRNNIYTRAETLL